MHIINHVAMRETIAKWIVCFVSLKKVLRGQNVTHIVMKLCELKDCSRYLFVKKCQSNDSKQIIHSRASKISHFMHLEREDSVFYVTDQLEVPNLSCFLCFLMLQIILKGSMLYEEGWQKLALW